MSATKPKTEKGVRYPAEFGEWTEAAAFRFIENEDGTVNFEYVTSLESITAPEAKP